MAIMRNVPIENIELSKTDIDGVKIKGLEHKG